VVRNQVKVAPLRRGKEAAYSISSSAADEERRRNVKAERLGGLEIYHKVESSGLLHGKIAGLLTSQVDV